MFLFLVKQGKNILKRLSTESSVSIPFDRTFRDVTPPKHGSTDPKSNFCGCGWYNISFFDIRQGNDRINYLLFF